MRKLVVSMNLSLDGFMSGPRDELDWHVETWSEAMSAKLLEILDNADTILLGRITYEAMAKYWPYKPLETGFPRQDQAIADKMNNYTKIVFSHYPLPLTWKNARYARRHFVEEIRELRHRSGKNLLLFGSGKLASSLIKSGVVDEYQLWIHPVLLGKGTPFFSSPEKIMNLRLSGSEMLEPGVVLLSYEPLTTKKLPPCGGNSWQ
jgi:dihydrofolate reductase